MVGPLAGAAGGFGSAHHQYAKMSMVAPWWVLTENHERPPLTLKNVDDRPLVGVDGGSGSTHHQR
jgi:hypothetical protein